MRSVTKRFFAARRFMLLPLGIIGVSHSLAGQPQDGESDWSFNATIIEACRCPNPCPCNFNSTKPATHSGHGLARGGILLSVQLELKGNFGNELNGVKFWMAGLISVGISHDQADWEC
jgi:hypothetical protein